MDVQETPFLKEAMDRKADRVPDAGHRSKGVRARPQMRDLTQELQLWPFFCSGYLKASAGPRSVSVDACNSTRCLVPGEAFSSPVTRMLAPVVTCLIVSL